MQDGAVSTDIAPLTRKSWGRWVTDKMCSPLSRHDNTTPPLFIGFSDLTSAIKSFVNHICSNAQMLNAHAHTNRKYACKVTMDKNRAMCNCVVPVFRKFSGRHYPMYCDIFGVTLDRFNFGQ